MDYRIEKRGAFRVVGFVTHSTMENGKSYKAVAKLWTKVMLSSKRKNILSMINQPPFGLIGMSVYNTDTEDARKLDYYIAYSTDKAAMKDMSEYTVPAATWAVFPCKKDEVKQVEIDIVAKWLPTSEYDPLNTGYESGMMKSSAPDLVVYAENRTAEVWSAVKQK